MSHSNIAHNTGYKVWIGTAKGADSFMNHGQTHTCKDVAFWFVDIPAVEDTACRPCQFGPSPACPLDICAEEAMCMSG